MAILPRNCKGLLQACGKCAPPADLQQHRRPVIGMRLRSRWPHSTDEDYCFPVSRASLSEQLLKRTHRCTQERCVFSCSAFLLMSSSSRSSIVLSLSTCHSASTSPSSSAQTTLQTPSSAAAPVSSHAMYTCHADEVVGMILQVKQGAFQGRLPWAADNPLAEPLPGSVRLSLHVQSHRTTDFT
jgi:hypothetical protein